MSLEHTDSERVAVALFPMDYETVEMVTDRGEEILQQDFSEAQLFMHSIQELERMRNERTKTKKRKIVGGNSDDGKATKKKLAADSTSDDTSELDPVGADIDVKAEQLDADTVMTDDVGAPKENGTTGHDDDLAAEDVDDKVIGTEGDESDELQEDVIDPRIHYRPMVAELLASIIELNQLINTIELIRRRDFLEDMQCIRENTMEKKEELEYLIESKSDQLKESSRILLAGVDALASTVEKESNFFDGVTEMIRKWKICAPIHGNIPKPFRAGEPLAVDCSFLSAGSTYAPPNRSIADLSFAELSRTEKGLVCVKTPEEYMPRTVQVQLRSVTSGATGKYTLPTPEMNTTSKAVLDRLENTPEDLKILDDRNVSVLKAVQFSVFCEELFYSLMQEALWSSASWSDSALSTKKPVAKKTQRNEDHGALGSGNISVVEVLEDEVRLRLRDQYEMTIKLLDSSNVSPSASSNDTAIREENGDLPSSGKAWVKAPNGLSSKPESKEASTHRDMREHEFLRETCRFALVLLQQETRRRHGRSEISRGILFSSADIASNGVFHGAASSLQTDTEKSEIGGTLAGVINVISHNLLKMEITRYLDDVSAKLALQSLQVSSTGRILEDGLNQPICDSVRGIYASPRWKICPYDSTLSAFDLNIGKNFTTEILLSGTKIRFEDGPGTLREISSFTGLTQFVEKSICSQVAQSLHRDLVSFGLKQATVDLDRVSVRLFVAGEWDGSCIGDGRVPDTKPTSCIFFEPHFTADMNISIKCALQAVNLSNVATIATPRKSGKGEILHEIEWQRIPGSSDVAKVVWLLQKTTGLPDFLKSRSHAVETS